jgi:hypothetical protein
MQWSIERTVVAFAVMVWLALLGLIIGKTVGGGDAAAQDAAALGTTVLRSQNGETQTGVVETVTLDGEIRRVIRWRTKEGTVTQRAAGPTRYRTVAITSPGQTRTTTLPGQTATVTLPGETVTQTNTETVTETNTVTVTETVTEEKGPPPKP